MQLELNGAIRLQSPSYYRDGKFIFVVGYTGGFGAEMCIHLTRKEIEKRCREKVGPGQLIVKRLELWWKPTKANEKR